MAGCVSTTEKQSRKRRISQHRKSKRDRRLPAQAAVQPHCDAGDGDLPDSNVDRQPTRSESRRMRSGSCATSPSEVSDRGPCWLGEHSSLRARLPPLEDDLPSSCFRPLQNNSWLRGRGGRSCCDGKIYIPNSRPQVAVNNPGLLALEQHCLTPKI